MNEKVVLVGAGSMAFTQGMVADFIRGGHAITLVLVDIDPTALRIIHRLAKKMIEHQQAPIELSSTTDRKKAFQDATVVISTIAVGGRRAWEKDVFIPRKYGIYQPVGDSVMPGGTSRALRMIDAMVDIARDFSKICPKALFFNYANPMGPICRAIHKETGLPVVGLCHGVLDSARSLARLLGEDFSKLRYTAVGMNHLTWMTEVKVGSQDAFPRMRRMADVAFETLRKNPHAIGKRFWEAGTAERDDIKTDYNVCCWQLFKLFNAYPVPGDRHVTEFFGRMFSSKNAYFGKTLGVDTYSFEACIGCGDGNFAKRRSLAMNDKPLPDAFFEKMSGEHEQATEIIESIRLNRPAIYSVNLPNAGQVDNFPKGAVIESPAVATYDGLRPVILGPVSKGIAGILATRFQWVETVVEAAMEGSRDKFIQALLLDGAVSSMDQATRLADELLQAQRPYLPKFFGRK